VAWTPSCIQPGAIRQRPVGGTTSPAGDNSQVLPPQASFPAIAIPMGFTHGMLPAGLTFLGPEFSESTLIRYA